MAILSSKVWKGSKPMEKKGYISNGKIVKNSEVVSKAHEFADSIPTIEKPLKSIQPLCPWAGHSLRMLLCVFGSSTLRMFSSFNKPVVNMPG